MGEEFKPKLLDLIPKEREWMAPRGGAAVGGTGGRANGLGAEVEKRLELRLGLPGGEEEEEQQQQHMKARGEACGYFSKAPKNIMSNSCSRNRGAGFMGLANGKEKQQQRLERNANSSETRTSNVPLVGWPPIRSFRKNLASTSKPSVEQQNNGSENINKIENIKKGLFVKINMDGIPIGRKVDLNAYDNYDQLSLAVDNLFRGLLSAQRDPLAALEEKQVLTGLLDGSGEYRLVYDDTEGDRMLVGDVPWNMFVSTAKRLRVLKTSDLSALSLGGISRKRTAPESCTG